MGLFSPILSHLTIGVGGEICSMYEAGAKWAAAACLIGPVNQQDIAVLSRPGIVIRGQTHI